jgi:hypothetical protein
MEDVWFPAEERELTRVFVGVVAVPVLVAAALLRRFWVFEVDVAVVSPVASPVTQRKSESASNQDVVP